MSKSNHNFTKAISNTIFTIATPIVDVFSYPFKTAYVLILDFQELVDAKEQNASLRLENQELKKAVVSTFYVKKENQELRKVLRFAAPKSTNYMTVQVVGRSYGLFNHNLTVKHPEESVIKDGSITVYKKSVIGRVVQTLSEKSRIMLLTDAKSRIPVVSADSRNRGILTGSNSGIMEIKYLSKNHTITEGELIFTSSDGGQIIPGILTGVVTKVSSGRVFVEIIEDINNIDQVTILQY